MLTLPNPLRAQLAQELHRVLQEQFSLVTMGIAEIYQLLEIPPSFELGHYAFPCFSLAKQLRKGPPQIAAQLKPSLDAASSLFAVVANVGPYLNVTFRPEVVGENIAGPILTGDYFRRPLIPAPQRIMIEYSQPNTHKELHVGHLRNLALGNALVQMNKYVGHQVYAVTYPGDMGTHVAKTLWYLQNCYQGEYPTTERGSWLGDIYALANERLTAANTPELAQILKDLEAKVDPTYQLWQTTRQWSIDHFREAYQWAGVEFDHWYFESEVDSVSLQRVRRLYQEGKLVESQGAIGMDLSAEKLGFCLLQKSDGNGLYATKDLELAYQKFDQYQLDANYYIVDIRQSYHFDQVFAVLKKLGMPQAEKCHHLAYDFVELPTGAMSSRKGNVITGMSLIAQMEKTIIANYLEKYRNIWTDEEIAATARMVSNGAIKYGMLKIDIGKKIVFAMEEWLKLDGETGPYLQYVHARIRSLEQKLGPLPATSNWQLLERPQESALLWKIGQFNDVIVAAASSSRPGTLCSYLFDLGKLFNCFYAECPIAGAPSSELRAARLGLASATGKVMKQGLACLGIPAPERM